MTSDLSLLKSTINEVIEENQTIRNITTRMDGVESEIKCLRGEMNTKFGKMDTKISALAEMQHRQGLQLEHMQDDMKLILEALVPLTKKAERFDQIDSKFENYDVRLCAVEITLKSQRNEQREI